MQDENIANLPVVLCARCCEGGWRVHDDGFAADVWPLGITLHFMLAGTFPLIDRLEGEKTESYDHKRLFEASPGIRPSARSLLEGMLKTDPKRRYTVQMVRSHPWLTQSVTTATAGEATLTASSAAPAAPSAPAAAAAVEIVVATATAGRRALLMFFGRLVIGLYAQYRFLHMMFPNGKIASFVMIHIEWMRPVVS